MKRLSSGLLIATSLTFATPALAQSAAPTASEVRAQGGTVPALLSSPESDGKEVYFAQGMQGDILVEGVVGTDGAFHDSSIRKSSRSSELDAFAKGLIDRATFTPAKDKSGQPVAVKVAIPVHLWKDSMVDGTIFSKSCKDFVIDADWHAHAFPEERPNQLRSWLLFSGAMVAAQFQNGGKIKDGPAFEAVYAACLAKPSRKFSDVFLGRK